MLKLNGHGDVVELLFRDHGFEKRVIGHHLIWAVAGWTDIELGINAAFGFSISDKLVSTSFTPKAFKMVSHYFTHEETPHLVRGRCQRPSRIGEFLK